jgi:hypothetical protein
VLLHSATRMRYVVLAVAAASRGWGGRRVIVAGNLAAAGVEPRRWCRRWCRQCRCQ